MLLFHRKLILCLSSKLSPFSSKTTYSTFMNLHFIHSFPLVTRMRMRQKHGKSSNQNSSQVQIITTVCPIGMSTLRRLKPLSLATPDRHRVEEVSASSFWILAISLSRCFASELEKIKKGNMNHNESYHNIS